MHPYDDPDVIAGQGTIGMEILRQHPEPIDAIFVAVGGGGLIAGIAAYVKRLRPEIKIIGVEPVDADAMYRSLKAGQRVTLAQVGLFADGVAVKQVGRGNLPPVPRAGRRDRSWSTPTPSAPRSRTCSRTRARFSSRPARWRSPAPRPTSSASGVRGKTLVAIACGANMNFDRLRFVAERAELGEQREAILAVTIPEQPGSFKAFCALLGPRNITEFNYRYADPAAGPCVRRRAGARPQGDRAAGAHAATRAACRRST